MPTRRGTKSLPPEARPRERCLRLGAEALSEVELISLLLGTGRAGEDVQDVARGALAAFGSLDRLARASAREIAELPGFGPARAAMLQAAFELGRRKASREGTDTRLDSSQAAAALLMPWFSRHKEERFVVLCLDMKQRLLKQEEVFKGTLTSSLVHPREVFATAIRERAASILVAHNHPSGDPAPSDEDLAITKRLEEAGRLIGIPLTDHLIIGREGFLSFRAAGLLGR
jgi:DNA repair protein RadC